MISRASQLLCVLLGLLAASSCTYKDDSPHIVKVSADPAGRKFGDIRLIVTDTRTGDEFESKHLPTSWAIPINLPPGGEYAFQVIMIDGYVSETIRIDSRAGSEDTIHFSHYRYDGAEIIARVTDDSTGLAIPSAFIELQNEQGHRIGTGQTDDAGKVRFSYPKTREELAIGRELRLDVKKSGYAHMNYKFTRNDQSQQLSVALQRIGEEVTFIVVDSWDSSPIAGATVHGTTHENDVPQFRGQTDAEGRLTLRLQPGDYSVTTDAPGFKTFESLPREEAIRHAELYPGTRPPRWRLGDVPSTHTIRLEAGR